ncbi:hypothetical protein D9M68_467180 [compost metagenome]
MKFLKLDLLTLLISLFLFASCENTSTIGMEIDPSSAIQGDFTDTLSVTSTTLKEDVAQTNNLTRHPLGYMTDPIFGSAEAAIAMTVGVPATSYSFGDLPVLDSAVLILKYGGEFYGDSTQNYSIDVHQLTKTLSSYETFPSNQTYPYNSTVIGNRTGKLFPNTKVKVLDIVTANPDTFKYEDPQIRIKLDPTFINDNIVQLPSVYLKNDIAFEDSFKGLYVQVNKASSPGKGGMAFVDLSSGGSYLSLYYKKSGTVDVVDTVNVFFPVGSTVLPVAATIKHNYAGTPIETQLNQPNKQFQETYLQPLTGLRNRISFPYLAKFKEQAGKIVVNKAELVIDLTSGTDLKPFEAAPRLSLYRYDIAEQRVNLPDNSPGSDPRGFQDPTIFGGYFNPVTRQYIFTITSYIQDLINNKTKDYGTFLAPTPSDEFLVAPSLGSAARAVLNAHKKNPAAGEGTMKLNIYYTKIN